MNWIPRCTTPIPPGVPLAQWVSSLNVSPALVHLLWNRGLRDVQEMQTYLNPMLQALAPLHEWPGLLESAQIIADALFSGQTMAVWGDYDVDGITSATLVVEFMARHGIHCLYYIPNRLTEGYGLNKEGIAALYKQGVTLLLTVDSGISDTEAVAFAKSLGMTVIISDHHLPAETLPPADCIVNPRLAPCPCPSLAGVGVAFFLMAGVNACFAEKTGKKIDIRNVLDLVAMGTLADVVNVTGQNRILVKNGLLLIANGKRPGIAALKSACNFSPTATLGAAQVVYSMAPRINAAGRLGSSKAAIDLLRAKDLPEATSYADSLVQLNVQRREEEDKIFEEAKEQALQQVTDGRMGIVLYNESWHQGVIGIVASRILEAHHRPVVVITSAGNFLKGSGRTVSEFDIHSAFCQCEDILLGYGGHKMAAGLSLAPSMLETFRERFNHIAVSSLGNVSPRQTCKIDAELPLSMAAEFDLLKELEMLQPFGPGNPEPVFSSPPLLVKNVIQRNGFCTMDVEEEESGITLRAKAWRELAASIDTKMKGTRVVLAYSPRIDRYNGVATVELRLKDWKPASTDMPAFIRLGQM